MVDLALIELPNLALESPTMYHPLGVLYLASVVEHAGYSVIITDLRDGIKELPQAKFYGFSCTTPEVNSAKRLAKQVKGITMIGGAHASLLPYDCLDDFDYVVQGEGEEVILQILGGHCLPSLYQGRRIPDLDKIPYPAWDMVSNPFSDTLFTGERYGRGQKTASMIISRGCPFHCSFCGNVYLNPIAFRSVQNVKGEIDELMKRGVRHLRFVDDNFTLHPQFEALCNMLQQCNVHYRCHTRSDRLTIEQARLMKQSGCEECSLGVESADPKVLKINHKGIMPEKHGNAIEILRQVGIRSKVYLMAGLPGETDNSVELTKEFMMRYKPDKWTLSTFTPYPGCDVWFNPSKYNVTIVNPNWGNWWNFVMPIKGKDLPGREGFVHVLDGQTLEQMGERHDEFYQWLRREAWK